MKTHELRRLDTGDPLTIWAPGQAESSACGHGGRHGLCVEVEVDDDAPQQPIAATLLLRPTAYRDGDVYANGPRRRVRIDFATGEIEPSDPDARSLLDSTPWARDELHGMAPLLADRARRIAGQRDRSTIQPELLEHADGMRPYASLFPCDWDIIVEHRKRSYWVTDFYCLVPGCDCNEITLIARDLADPVGAGLGEVRIPVENLRAKLTGPTPISVKVARRTRKLHGDLLRRRYAEVRGAVDAATR